MKTPFVIPNEVSRITEALKNAGFETYLIGGCVRDLFLGRKPQDWDVTTNAKPDEIVELFPKTFYENEYGTVGVVSEETTDETLRIIEVTPYRTEGVYTDRRRPDKVSFNATLEDDLKRRDFTINAIALDIEKNLVVDPFNGRKDIQNGVIRTVGSPNERFGEDGLRLLRAIRIQAELGFEIESQTERAIAENAHLLDEIAKERIRDEFIRVLESADPVRGLSVAQKLGILDYIAPIFRKTTGIKQNKAHSYDVWTHLLKSLEHAVKKKYPLHVKLAALFHDISKPESRRWSEEKRDWTFYGHEVMGERVTRETLKDLKFPKETIESVAKLVRWHMFFSDTEKITHSAVRRLVAHVGKESIWDLIDLRTSDRIGTGRPKESPYRLRKYKAMIDEVLSDPVSVSMLKVDGAKIMEIAGLSPGPKIGYILHALLEEVLENPSLNTETKLEKMAKKLACLADEELRRLGEEGKLTREKKELEKIRKIRQKHWVE
ncbi:HD domain-containing protein [Patescibacteria group bacterium]|nr:MAG: HD domain-containing protein [Patescibacteria group bacterium]